MASVNLLGNTTSCTLTPLVPKSTLADVLPRPVYVGNVWIEQYLVVEVGFTISYYHIFICI